MNKLSIITLFLLLPGCMNLETYKASKTNTTEINIKKLSSAWLCIDQKKYSLVADDLGNAKIPTGKRITIGNSYMWEDFNIRYSCNPSISFIPENETLYHANWEIIAEACRIEVFKKTNANRIGLDFEPSLEHGKCNAP